MGYFLQPNQDPIQVNTQLNLNPANSTALFIKPTTSSIFSSKTSSKEL